MFFFFEGGGGGGLGVVLAGFARIVLRNFVGACKASLTGVIAGGGG